MARKLVSYFRQTGWLGQGSQFGGRCIERRWEGICGVFCTVVLLVLLYWVPYLTFWLTLFNPEVN